MFLPKGISAIEAKADVNYFQSVTMRPGGSRGGRMGSMTGGMMGCMKTGMGRVMDFVVDCYYQ